MFCPAAWTPHFCIPKQILNFLCGVYGEESVGECGMGKSREGNP